MSIETSTIVSENIYTAKSVNIMILNHPRNDKNTNRYLLWIPQKLPSSGTFTLESSVPTNSNISAKEFQRFNKYKDLYIEIAKM